MASMRQIRNRIRVAGNIAQITGAMEMVAAAQLRRAQDRLVAARPYLEGLGQIVSDVVRSLEAQEGRRLPPLASPRSEGRGALLVLAADRGLCGSYNSNVLRLAMETLTEGKHLIGSVMAVGRRGRLFLRRRGYELAPLPVENSSGLTYEQARDIARRLMDMFLSGEASSVQVLYTRFVSPLVQRPVVEQLLPIDAGTVALQPHDGRDRSARDMRKFLFEPTDRELAETLLPYYVSARMYYMILESAASEHGARMTAMSAATDNATNMISTLTLALNRARQAAITKEISEIVSGAEALKS